MGLREGLAGGMVVVLVGIIEGVASMGGDGVVVV